MGVEPESGELVPEADGHIDAKFGWCKQKKKEFNEMRLDKGCKCSGGVNFSRNLSCLPGIVIKRNERGNERILDEK